MLLYRPPSLILKLGPFEYFTDDPSLETQVREVVDGVKNRLLLTTNGPTTTLQRGLDGNVDVHITFPANMTKQFVRIGEFFMMLQSAWYIFMESEVALRSTRMGAWDPSREYKPVKQQRITVQRSDRRIR